MPPITPTTPDSDSGSSPTLDAQRVRRAVAVLRALHHPLRQRILKLLLTVEELTVTQLFVDLRIEQSVASQHLAVLRKVDLVVTRRRGKYVHYAINRDRFTLVLTAIDQLYPPTGA